MPSFDWVGGESQGPRIRSLGGYQVPAMCPVRGTVRAGDVHSGL